MSKEKFKFPFGEHEGKTMDKIPAALLEWCCVNITYGTLSDEVKDELNRRNNNNEKKAN